MDDKTKTPEGYRAYFDDSSDYRAHWKWWWDTNDDPEPGAYATEAEAVAACWTHANRQRAIGVRKTLSKLEVMRVEMTLSDQRELNAYADRLEKGEIDDISTQD